MVGQRLKPRKKRAQGGIYGGVKVRTLGKAKIDLTGAGKSVLNEVLE
jgi:hypothetical protein